MPFQIIRNDITKVCADAIVNTANPRPTIGSGTDSAIYAAAGKEELLAARSKIGDIPVGKCAVTSAFALPAQYIIHTVAPSWRGGTHGEEAALRSCYEKSLKMAVSLGCASIAFPLLATGNYDYPKDQALSAATSVIYEFLMENDMMVYLVVFDREAYDLSGKLFRDVTAYIDEHYVAEKEIEEREGTEYRAGRPSRQEGQERRREDIILGSMMHLPDTMPAASLPEEALSAATAGSLDDHLRGAGITFQEYLLQLIIDKDMKNADVYHGANITKQHFSKIMSNPDYHPTKNTACALAIALHLDLPTTQELLEKAGLALSHSSRFDLAVEYFILNKKYNILDDNITLYSKGIETLGTQ